MTGLTRSKPLVSRTGLKRGRIRQQSTKAKRTAAMRRALARNLIGSPCVVRWDESCMGVGTHLHEPLLRSRGGDPTAPENTIWVCLACHDSIHRNPKEATRRGWMRHAWVCVDSEAAG